MFEKILYPTDFSDVSQKALEYIKRLKEAGTEEVVLLYVHDIRGDESVHRVLGSSQFEQLQKGLEKEAKKMLSETEKALHEAGLKVKPMIRKGIPVKGILRVETEENVSAIVIGSHGVSNIQGMLLGSVSEKVIRRCEKPVLVIKR